jgi:hypothetical protein
MSERRRKQVVDAIGTVVVIVALNLVLRAVGVTDLHLPSLDVPDLPELPGWLRVVLGPGKTIAIGLAIVVGLVLVAVDDHRRGKERDGH